MTPQLSIQDLSVTFPGDPRSLARSTDRGLSDVSFEVARGETTALVGESGSGKSLTALSILRLLAPAPRCQIQGRIYFEGQELLSLPEREMQRLRGARIAMSFQEAESALNPTTPVGNMLLEPIRTHLGLSGTATRQKAEQCLSLVGIANPRETMQSYPHELSGGTRQRVLLAMALSCNPSLLIADQPVSGVDPTTQAQLMDVLSRVQGEHSMTLLLITHNLGLVAENAKRVMVFYAGQIVEQGPTARVFEAPAHPYTRALLQSVPPSLPSGDPSSRRLHAFAGGGRIDPEPGCRFRGRCSLTRTTEETERCRSQNPELRIVSEARLARCHFAERSDA